MSQISFQLLSESEQRVIDVTKEPTVLNTRLAIAKLSKCRSDCIDFVDMNDVIILKDDKILKRHQVINAVYHPQERKIPLELTNTTKPDITDETITEPRVLMSCGHALTPDNLYSYIQVTLKDGMPSIRCFKCNTAWDFDEVSIKSAMSRDEKIFWGAKLSMNAINKDDDIDAATCPVCGLFCQRIDVRNPAVRCFSCTRTGNAFDFCWECRKPWTTGHSCETLEEAQDILSNCPRKTIDYSHIENVPSVRACPKCNAIIEHMEACKQMECKFCQTNFCFVCLKVCKDKSLTCSGYSQICTVAPIQNIIQ